MISAVVRRQVPWPNENAPHEYRSENDFRCEESVSEKRYLPDPKETLAETLSPGAESMACTSYRPFILM